MVETRTNTVGGADLGSVAAGALIAVAITVVLSQFAAGIGYSIDSPLRTEGLAATFGIIGAGIWLLFTQVISSMLGGYVTGRLRTHSLATDTHEVEVRDGMHGLATWALSTLLVVIGVGVVAAFGSAFAVADEVSTAAETVTDAEANAAIIFGFANAATSLLAGVVAWWAAVKGGDHRDTQADFRDRWSLR